MQTSGSCKSKDVREDLKLSTLRNSSLSLFELQLQRYEVPLRPRRIILGKGLPANWTCTAALSRGIYSLPFAEPESIDDALMTEKMA